LTAAEIRSIVKAAGGVAAVLNTRHAIAKANGWKESAPSAAAFIAAVQEHSNVIRRPILVKDGKAVVGRDETATRELLG
jgi:arsenate reductase-like glutaredoxin family protein